MITPRIAAAAVWILLILPYWIGKCSGGKRKIWRTNGFNTHDPSERLKLRRMIGFYGTLCVQSWPNPIILFTELYNHSCQQPTRRAGHSRETDSGPRGNTVKTKLI